MNARDDRIAEQERADRERLAERQAKQGTAQQHPNTPNQNRQDSGLRGNNPQDQQRDPNPRGGDPNASSTMQSGAVAEGRKYKYSILTEGAIFGPENKRHSVGETVMLTAAEAEACSAAAVGLKRLDEGPSDANLPNAQQERDRDPVNHPHDRGGRTR